MKKTWTAFLVWLFLINGITANQNGGCRKRSLGCSSRQEGSNSALEHLIFKFGLKVLGKDQESAEDKPPEQDNSHHHFNAQALIHELYSPSTSSAPTTRSPRAAPSTESLPIKAHDIGWFDSPTDMIMQNHIANPVFDHQDRKAKQFGSTTQGPLYLTETQYYLDSGDEDFSPLVRSRDGKAFDGDITFSDHLEKPVIHVADIRPFNFAFINDKSLAQLLEEVNDRINEDGLTKNEDLVQSEHVMHFRQSTNPPFISQIMHLNKEIQGNSSAQITKHHISTDDITGEDDDGQKKKQLSVSWEPPIESWTQHTSHQRRKNDLRPQQQQQHIQQLDELTRNQESLPNLDPHVLTHGSLSEQHVQNHHQDQQQEDNVPNELQQLQHQEVDHMEREDERRDPDLLQQQRQQFQQHQQHELLITTTIPNDNTDSKNTFNETASGKLQIINNKFIETSETLSEQEQINSLVQQLILNNQQQQQSILKHEQPLQKRLSGLNLQQPGQKQQQSLQKRQQFEETTDMEIAQQEVHVFEGNDVHMLHSALMQVRHDTGDKVRTVIGEIHAFSDKRDRNNNNKDNNAGDTDRNNNNDDNNDADTDRNNINSDGSKVTFERKKSTIKKRRNKGFIQKQINQGPTEKLNQEKQDVISRHEKTREPKALNSEAIINHSTNLSTFICPRLEGIFADQSSSCQMFVMCQSDGRKSAFNCPTGTLFNQKYKVCDWPKNVDCENAHIYFNIS